MAKAKVKTKEAFVPDWKSIGIGVAAGILLITIIMLAGGRVKEWSFLGIKIGFPETAADVTDNKSVGSVSLASVSYEYDDWDPKIVDLRTASESGIPVSPGHALKLFDLFVYVPDDITNYVVVAAIYGNDELVGLTESQRLVPGMNKLSDVEIKNYHHDTVDNAWRLQDDWESIRIVLMYYIAENKVGSTSNTILLNPSGKSWYISAPYGSIISVVYRINDGPEIVADLRTITEVGIPVFEGDTLTITEAWYQSGTDDNTANIQLEAYTSSGRYDSQTLQISEKGTFQSGFHEILNDRGMQWVITDDKESLVMTLARNSDTVMDRIVIPFSEPGSSGLTSNDNVIYWPFGFVDYYDFERTEDFTGWTSIENNVLTTADDQAFSGFHSLAISTSNSESQQFVAFSKSFKSNLIVGQVYWPKQEGIRVEWAQACVVGAGKCVPVSQQPNQWNSFVLHLDEMKTDNGELLSEIDLSGLYLQGWIDGASQEIPYTFYLDSIQIYPADVGN